MDTKHTSTAVQLFATELVCLVLIYVLLQAKASLPLALIALTISITAVGVYVVNILFISRLYMERASGHSNTTAMRTAAITAIYPIVAVLLYTTSQ